VGGTQLIRTASRPDAQWQHRADLGTLLDARIPGGERPLRTSRPDRFAALAGVAALGGVLVESTRTFNGNRVEQTELKAAER
jgi:hypothetical protein